uniref:CLPTM1 regulator of GABA type A receptor forward trafficking n=1 Tax=Molossus molossus TaxID=27622 RepID=A0A7J8C6K8_MOLMO|nr:CLPTM1 regulator of GABA type A receptor forward trafficking [Molossus molossus]
MAAAQETDGAGSAVVAAGGGGSGQVTSNGSIGRDLPAETQPQNPPRGPALPPSPRKSLQSQQRTRKGINCFWSSSSAPAPGDHCPCQPGPLASPPYCPFPGQIRPGQQEMPLWPGPNAWCWAWGRPGHMVCGGAICLSVSVF